MSDYDISGTIFYNPVIGVLTVGRGAPPLVQSVVALIAPPAGLRADAVERWEAALYDARALTRGRAVLALSVRPGRIAARVALPGSQVTHNVKIGAPVAAEPLWQEIAAQAAGQIQLAAALSRGEAPAALLAALALPREALVFERDDQAVSLAPLPDMGALAPWYAFAGQVRADPWLWVLFRGQTREGLLALAERVRVAQASELDHEEPALSPAEFWLGGALPSMAAAPRARSPGLFLLDQLRAAPPSPRAGRRAIAKVLISAAKRRQARSKRMR